jgi:hypothetical protein
MTVWKAGMLAVCVRGGPNDFDAQSGLFAGPYGEMLVERKVYRVIRVLAALDGTGRIGLYVDESHDAGWFADRFRPLIDQQDDLDLIAKIKACKPRRAPVIPDRRHVISGFPTATASPDSRVSAPGASPTFIRTGGTLAQPHENSIHQHIKSDSFVHGASIT